MIKNEYKVIGVMSGTSLDGIDLAYVHFNYNGEWNFKILCSQTVAYTSEWITILKNLIDKTKEELRKIDKGYTQYISEVINRFIAANNIKEIDAICSHGHTALHEPDKGFTYQLGNRQELSSLVNNLVVCDFRPQDVALGGQGAPLVPIGDRLLFSQYAYCLNLGGFANISTEINQQRVAYDICPVNIVLNFYVSSMGLDFDDGGAIASKGAFNQELFNALNVLDYYAKPFPKSLGLEWVMDFVVPLIDTFGLDTAVILRTFIEHIAFQISKAVNPNSEVFITGGGVYNIFLMNRIKELSAAHIIIPDNEVVEFKEALIFGLLGVLRLRNEINCLSSVTGAKMDHSSGILFPV